MEKVIIRLVLIVAFFFATYTALKEVDWLTLFNVEHLTSKSEEKLGELFWEYYSQNEHEIKDTIITIPIDSILATICKANNINKDNLKLHVISSDEINAFALPNKHLIINLGLLKAVENQDELCGVICHELAHIEKNHVSQKLIKEIGLSILISNTIGNSSPEIINNAVMLLSSTAYDRKHEKEADLQAIDYMLNANVDPAPFASFLRNSFGSDYQFSEHLSWISTHPDANDRADYIFANIENSTRSFNKILAAVTWDNLKLRIVKE